MIKRFLDCYVPVTMCNLQCHYCYISQLNAFEKKIPEFKFSAEQIKQAMTLERLGGPCVINLCGGGETLIPKEVVDITRVLLENGHYVMIVTNGLLKNRLEEIAKFPRNLLAKLFFKFSFHYLELKRLNAFEKYFDNIRMMDSAGCSFTVEMTPCDEVIPYIDEIKDICIKNVGAPCHISIGRRDNDPQIRHLSKYSFEDYCRLWGDAFDSQMFEFKKSIFYQKRKEFCYAGVWSANINLGTGDLTQCYGGRTLDNIFKNLDHPIKFSPVGTNCNQPHCYNGHAFLTFGDIPELKTPTYQSIRDRATINGMVWIKPQMQLAFTSKLIEENRLYSASEKLANNVKGLPHRLKAEIYHKMQEILKHKL